MERVPTSHRPPDRVGTILSTHHEDTRLLPVHEALGDGIRCQDLVSEEEEGAGSERPQLQFHTGWDAHERGKVSPEGSRRRHLPTKSLKDRGHSVNPAWLFS